MDKQIIIDNVDVSGCEAYKDKHCKDKTSIMFCNTNLCSNFPNCYYKQLKAKEQECEELKEQLTILNGEDVVVEITVKQFEEYKKLKQTLTEIKEIAEKIEDECGYLGFGSCANKAKEQILQKISEVLK